MADSSEKTEDPTGKRIQDARSKGQIARSRELSTTLVLVASSLMLLLFGSFIAEALFAISGRMFTLSRDENATSVEQPYPLVAWQRYGSGKTMFVGTADLWRLRREVGERFHSQFWSQAIQFLALYYLL